MSDIPFSVYKGLENKILNSPKVLGAMYFATDTRKIYYCDGSSFISMGGNSGIYYGNFELEINDSEDVNFTISPNEIDGDSTPNENDLIFNMLDGCFYKVTSVDQEIENNIQINILKLTVAASDSSSTKTAILKFTNLESSTNIYCLPNQDNIIHYKIESSNELDSIAKIEYLFNSTKISNETDYNEQPFGEKELDLTKWLPYLSSKATTLEIRITDLFGVKKPFYYNLYYIKINLQESETNNQTQTLLTVPDGNLIYSCYPMGGTQLFNKQLIYKIYNNQGELLKNPISLPINQTSKIYNQEIDLTFFDNIGIGDYSLTVQYIGYTEANSTGLLIESNILTYTLISYGVNPVLAAYIPKTEIEQYSILDIQYMVGTTTIENTETQVNLIFNNTITPVNIEFNKIYTWQIYFDSIGSQNIEIQDAFGNIKTYNNIRVIPYSGTIPVINDNDITLDINLTTYNRNNNELSRNLWEDRTCTGTLTNFIWGSTNGWLIDENQNNMLRVSSGAKVNIENTNAFLKNTAMTTGYTIELDFKLSGISDYTKPLISCISKNQNEEIVSGFIITGFGSTFNTSLITATGATIKESDSNEDQAYNTSIQGLTSKFIENERIHLSWVIEKNSSNTINGQAHPLIKTYLNGILSGITEYDENDNIYETNNDKAKIIIDSQYGVIDIYNIRFYQTALGAQEILNNYIATLPTLQERETKYRDNFNLLDDNNNIDIETFDSIDPAYELTIPYIKITGGQGLMKNDDGSYSLSGDTECHLPYTKKDYRLIQKFEFKDPTGKHTEVIEESEFKNDVLNGMILYGQGTSSMEYPIKNLRIKFKKKTNGTKLKFQVNNNDYPVDILTLKADYMESSSSHNTGTANLVYNLLEGMRWYTPGQQHYNTKNPEYKTLTAIRGYPILCFFKPADADENAPFEFIGRYNLNLDKSSEEVFGFAPDDNWGMESNANTNTSVNYQQTSTPSNTAGELSTLEHDSSQDLINAIHCYEFLNNASELANFLKESGDIDFYTTFFKTVYSEKEKRNVPNWFLSFESRYPEGEAKNGSDVDIWSWYKLCEWVNSTENNLEKFTNEFTNHFDLNFCAFYYVLTQTLLMIDSRAKNMMMATWDNQHWYPIFYDMDTMLGLNNYGYNKFDYNIEDTDPNVFNGQNSILWNNFRECFPDIIKSTYNELQKRGLATTNLLNTYNLNQADAWNEVMYNLDANYKYIKPFIQGYWNGLSGDKEWVAAGTKNYLYAGQGSRSMHRRYWITNRMNYLNGKYGSDINHNDKFTMRLYTPQAQEDNYYRVEIDEETFNADKTNYYIRTEIDNNYVFTQITNEDIFDEIQQYFMKASNKLKESLLAVAANNDFSLTPLTKQYLSVAYGGDNGYTTTPILTDANETRLIESNGKKYNDTETYIYGGSLLKDLGDLSSQYLGLFQFPDQQTKLEKLTLGNLNNKYYNPNFSSLTVGSSAPFLKELNIANCSGLKTTLNLIQCNNLEKIYATGSELTAISLPQHGGLQELRLPKTIKQLKIIDQELLTSLTIGTYDSDNETYANDIAGKSFVSIQLENLPNVDTYFITKIREVGEYLFKNIYWKIDELERNENEELIISGLEKFKTSSRIGNVPLNQAITGTIDLSAIDDIEAALAVYNNYITQYPSLNFRFNEEDICWIKCYKDETGTKIHWSTPIQKNTEIPNDFYRNLTDPRKEDTIDKVWTFSRWSNKPDTGTFVENSIDVLPIYTSSDRYYQVTFYNNQEIIEENWYKYGTQIKDIIPLIIPFKNGETLDTMYEFKGYNYNNFATDGLDFTNTDIVNKTTKLYAIFDNQETNVRNNIHYTDYFTFFPTTYQDDLDSKFNIGNGWIISPKQIRETIEENGQTIINTKYVILPERITIPTVYDNKPVISIQGFDATLNDTLVQTKVKRIFFEDNSQVREISSNCFYQVSQLEYIELPNSLRRIRPNAFRLLPHLTLPKEEIKDNMQQTQYVYNIGNNIYLIEQYAFNQCFNDEVNILRLGGNIQYIEDLGISYLNSAVNLHTIEIGSVENPSQLDLSINNSQPIVTNPGSNPPINKIIVYKESLSEEERRTLTVNGVQPITYKESLNFINN